MSITTPTRAPTADRLAELVVELSGAGAEQARTAVEAAIARQGADHDTLLAVAQALVTLRSTTAARRPEPLVASPLR